MNTYLSLSITKTLFTFFMITCIFHNPTNSESVQITKENIDTILAANELVVINFYVVWTRFSTLLNPIFEKAADVIAKEFPESGKVVMGKVNCDVESSIAERFHVGNSYPTIKIFGSGQPAKANYRGEKSVEGFRSFVKKQLEDPVKEFKQLKELQELESNKRIIIGYFDRKDQPEYDIFRRVATNLKSYCQFHAGFDEASRKMHAPDHPTIAFREDKNHSDYLDEIYPGNLTNFDVLYIWASEKCIPLVRELTLENEDELIGEGLPLLILFHKQDDEDSVTRFKKIVQADLLSEKKAINIAVANDETFRQSLRHFDKGQNQFPLIVIDGFIHLYFFPNYEDIEVPGKLKQFVQDLQSGKLHREYHYGPDSDREL